MRRVAPVAHDLRHRGGNASANVAFGSVVVLAVAALTPARLQERVHANVGDRRKRRALQARATQQLRPLPLVGAGRTGVLPVRGRRTARRNRRKPRSARLGGRRLHCPRGAGNVNAEHRPERVLVSRLESAAFGIRENRVQATVRRGYHVSRRRAFIIPERNDVEPARAALRVVRLYAGNAAHACAAHRLP